MVVELLIELHLSEDSRFLNKDQNRALAVHRKKFYVFGMIRTVVRSVFLIGIV